MASTSMWFYIAISVAAFLIILFYEIFSMSMDCINNIRLPALPERLCITITVIQLIVSVSIFWLAVVGIFPASIPSAGLVIFCIFWFLLEAMLLWKHYYGFL